MQIRIDERLKVREIAEAQSTDMAGRSPSQQCCRTTGPVPRSPVAMEPPVGRLDH